MKVSRVAIRTSVDWKMCRLTLKKESIFVGPNNSGKTSATAVFRCFLGGRDFKIYDFSVARIADFDTFGLTGDETLFPKLVLTFGSLSIPKASVLVEFSHYCQSFGFHECRD
jgi:predicted ATP-dependent endonuclease of OLD family